MGKVQRLNVSGLEGISTPYDGLRYSLLPAERLSSLLKKEEREIIGNDNFIFVVLVKCNLPTIPMELSK
jgi:hypothetical protein